MTDYFDLNCYGSSGNIYYKWLPKYKHWEYYGGRETAYNYDFCFEYNVDKNRRRFYWAPCSLGVAEFKY